MSHILDRVLSEAVSRRTMLRGAAGASIGAATLPLWGRTASAKEGAKRSEFSKKTTAAAAGHDTRVVLLGTAGGPRWWHRDGRHGPASILVVGDSVYLVDCGEGVGDQYTKATEKPNSVPSGRKGMENLRAVFITHNHADHIVDYANILLFSGYGTFSTERPVQVYGPGDRGQPEPITQVPGEPKLTHVPTINPDHPFPGISRTTDYLYKAYAVYMNDAIRDYHYPSSREVFQVHDIELPDIEGFVSPNETPEPAMQPFKVYEDSNVRVTATLINHFPIWPTFAYRFDSDDGSVVLAGDTSPSDNLIRLATNADVLVHEVIDGIWVDSLFPEPRSDADDALRHHLLSAHTTVDQVGRVAEKANVGTLVLNHIVPGNAPLDRLLQGRKNFLGSYLVGEDLMEIGVGRKRCLSR